MQHIRDGDASDVDAAFADPAFAEAKRRGAPFVIVRRGDGAVLWANAAAARHWGAADPVELARILSGSSGRGGWLDGLIRGLVPGRAPRLARGGLAQGVTPGPHPALLRAWTSEAGDTLVGFAVPDAVPDLPADGWRRTAWGSEAAAPPDGEASDGSAVAPADGSAVAPADGSAVAPADGTGRDLARRSRLAVLRDRLGRAVDGASSLRLLWRTDADGVATSPDAEVFPRLGSTLSFDGGTWPDLAARFDAAGAERLRGALATRETWSALALSLPLAEGAAKAPLVLSASPSFGPGRAFAGFRGFAILDLGGLALVPRTAPDVDADAVSPVVASAAEAREADPAGVDGAGPEVGMPPPETPVGPLRVGPYPGANVVPFRPYQEAGIAESGSAALASADRRTRSGEAVQFSASPDGDAEPPHPVDDQIAFLALGEALRARIGAAPAQPSDEAEEIGAVGPARSPDAEPEGDEAPAPGVPSPTGPHSAAVLPLADGPAPDGTGDRAAELLDRVDDGVALLDAAGRVRRLNRPGEAWFDRAGVEPALGRDVMDLLVPESRPAALALLGEVRNQRDGLAAPPLRREVAARTGEGTAVPTTLTLGRLGAGGFYATLRDNTALTRAEADRARVERDRARTAGRLPDLLAKVSHEIRTPLGAILGFAEVMMDERLGPLGNPRYKDYLKDIHAVGTQVVAMVDGLLDLSRVEAGQVDLVVAAVDVNRVVTETVAQMQPEAHKGRVIMRTSLAGRIPSALADERSARQIVRSLLSNAVKFNEPGGQVIVSTTLGDAGAVLLRVRDTGVGMSDEEIAEALEPLGSLPGHGSAGGSGFGLPLTRALVGANGASMTIRSRPREGTLVEVAFPSVATAEAPLQA